MKGQDFLMNHKLFRSGNQLKLKKLSKTNHRQILLLQIKTQAVNTAQVDMDNLLQPEEERALYPPKIT